MRIVGLKFSDYQESLKALAHLAKDPENQYQHRAIKMYSRFQTIEFHRNTQHVEIGVSTEELRVLEHACRRYQVEIDPGYKYLADHYSYLMNT